jgi:hypothetical protein
MPQMKNGLFRPHLEVDLLKQTYLRSASATGAGKQNQDYFQRWRIKHSFLLHAPFDAKIHFPSSSFHSVRAKISQPNTICHHFSFRCLRTAKKSLLLKTLPLHHLKHKLIKPSCINAWNHKLVLTVMYTSQNQLL